MLSRYFKISSLLDVILLPIWLRFRLHSPPKSRLGGILEASWAVLGASWAALGPSWALSWGILGRLGGILEASWSDFGTKMEPSWYQNLLNHGPYVKIASKLKTFIFLI